MFGVERRSVNLGSRCNCKPFDGTNGDLALYRKSCDKRISISFQRTAAGLRSRKPRANFRTSSEPCPIGQEISSAPAYLSTTTSSEKKLDSLLRPWATRTATPKSIATAGWKNLNRRIISWAPNRASRRMPIRTLASIQPHSLDRRHQTALVQYHPQAECLQRLLFLQ